MKIQVVLCRMALVALLGVMIVSARGDDSAATSGIAPLTPGGPAVLNVPAPDSGMSAPNSGGASNQAGIPTGDFPASRYQVLWTKSPFAVATAEGPTATSPDYVLYGITQVDGVSYASVVDRQTNQHFLISSDKETRGLRLTTITHATGSSDTFANVTKDGETLTLKLETALAGGPTPGAPVGTPNATPSSIIPNIPMPGGSGFPGGSNRPFIHMHRPRITLPPPPPP